MGPGVNIQDIGSIFSMSKFCVKPFSLLIFYLPCLIHDVSVALLLIWTAGSGAWMGPGVFNKDLAICYIILLLVLMYSLELKDA